MITKSTLCSSREAGQSGGLGRGRGTAREVRKDGALQKQFSVTGLV